MISKLTHSFCTYGQYRFYNNKFDLVGDKWSAQVTVLPPTLLKQETVVKVAKQSSLSIAVCSLEDKYKKGRKSQLYFIKMQDLIKLSVWKPTLPPLNFINTNKIVSFQSQDSTLKNIVVSFYDKNLSDDLKRKEIIVTKTSFQLFLDTLHAGIQEITNGNQNKLSYIHKLIKQFPPYSRVN